MAEVLLCCEMLEDEMNLAYRRTGSQIPVEWVDAGLHEYPDKLRAELEKRIPELERDYDTILMGFCLCGNALVGIGGGRARVVAPRFDDCIRMLMCRQAGALPDVDCHCMYFTECWTRHEEFIGAQYRRACEKYGQKKGTKVYKTMLKNYTGLRLVDTGAFPVEKGRAAIQSAAEVLELDYGEVDGSIRVLEKLLMHQWDEEFYVLEPGQKFAQMEFLRHPD